MYLCTSVESVLIRVLFLPGWAVTSWAAPCWPQLCDPGFDKVCPLWYTVTADIRQNNGTAMRAAYATCRPVMASLAT